MAAVIVEVRDSHHRIKAVHRVDNLPLTIGRGYNNDIILSDPFVESSHLLVEPSDNGWQVTDQQSVNKFYLADDAVTQAHVTSGDEIIVGKTYLRFVSPDHPVGAAKILHDKLNLTELVKTTGIVWLLLSVLVFAFASYDYLTTSEEVHIEKLIAGTLPIIGGVLLWAAIWSLLSYVVRRKLYFYVFLTITVVYVLIDLFLEWLLGIVAYNVINVFISEALSYFTGGLLLAAFFYASMHYALAISKRRKFMFANLFSWGLVAVIIFVVYANKPEFMRNPEYPTELKPPFARLVPADNVENFLADSELMLNDI